MGKFTFRVDVDVKQSARVIQLLGLFDVDKTTKSEREWTVELPDDNEPWRIGLIVGPSGSGKSTLARAAYGQHIADHYEWPGDKSVVDGFPAELGIKEVTELLSSVGFSTPPSWLRPFRCLSNGEQFRASLARALADPRPLVVVDEFTSVVDRTVAKIGSAAVAKAVRRAEGRKFVAVTCHEDVAEWLAPDWIVQMPEGTLTRRSLRRPAIELEVIRVQPSAWELFRAHHYLDTSLNRTAKCFVALWQGRPVAFASVLHNPAVKSFWREHRTVCLPDYQGVGIGNALSAFVGSLMKATGKHYYSTTGNPAMIAHRARSPLWAMRRKPSRNPADGGDLAGTGPLSIERCRDLHISQAKRVGNARATDRLTAGFEYVGPPNVEAARGFGII